MKLRPEYTSGQPFVRSSNQPTPGTPRSEGTQLTHRVEYRSTAQTVSLKTHGGGPLPGSIPPLPSRQDGPGEKSVPAYESSYDGEVNVWNRMAGAWMLGLLATIGLFLALPFFQLISSVGGNSAGIIAIDLSKPPPPAPPVEKTPPPEKKDQQDKPELEREMPKLTLSQLELALNPGMGDAAGSGDFSMNFQISAMDELEMIFELSEVDRIPQPIYRAAPNYPYEMKQAGISGTVELLFVCDQEGKVRRVQVRSSTHREFETPAINALREWRFDPGMKDGAPVNVRMMVPFKFNVRD